MTLEGESNIFSFRARVFHGLGLERLLGAGIAEADGQVVADGEVEGGNGFAGFLKIIVYLTPAAQLVVELTRRESDFRALAGRDDEGFGTGDVNALDFHQRSHR